MSKKTSALTLRRIGAILKAAGLPRSQSHVSPYTLLTRYLASQGIAKPPGQSDKAFAKAHADKQQLILDGCPIKRAPPKPKTKRTLDNTSVKQTKAISLNLYIGNIDPASEEFLYTTAWRQLRMLALKRYGARCQCCGATPADGKTIINVDHIKPRKLFPMLALDIDNLQILCNQCNHGKGNWDTTDWRNGTLPIAINNHQLGRMRRGFTCETCGAQPGENCKTANDNTVPNTHGPRQQKFLTAYAHKLNDDYRWIGTQAELQQAIQAGTGNPQIAPAATRLQ